MTDDDSQIAKFKLNDGTDWRLVGWKRIEGWLDDLQSAWEWSGSEPRHGDPTGVTPYWLSRITQLRSEAAALKASGAPPSDFGERAPGLMDSHAPFHQDSANGILVLEVRAAAGADAAIFASHMLKGLAVPSQAGNRDFFRGAMLASDPGLLRVQERALAFKEERSKFRTQALKLREEVEIADRNRHLEWEQSLRSAGQNSEEWMRRLTKRWLRYSLRARGRERAAMDKLKATDAAFTEMMGLKAPVKYWKDKASGHRTREFWTMLLVILFFVITLPGMAYVFTRTGVVLIDHAMAPRPQGAPPFPNAVFLIASAGLASCAGLVFWAGRLLTKLYLSQHHLRQDADERATMTETYLALIENSAASAEDRQVILNALFRNTPDGIVKEEGGLDPSIAAALGKFLAKP